MDTNEFDHLSELQLARLVLSDDPGNEDAHWVTCERCHTLLLERRNQAQLFRQHQIPRTVESVESRLRRSQRFRWAWVGLPLVAAVVLVFFLSTRNQESQNGAEKERVIASKGARAGYYLVAKRGDSVFRVKPESELYPGDSVRFVVNPGNYSYLLLLSLDGVQKVSLYHPYSGTQSAPMTAGKTIELADSIILDEAIGVEYLYGVFSKQVLSVLQVQEILVKKRDTPAEISGEIVRRFGSEKDSLLVVPMEFRKVVP